MTAIRPAAVAGSFYPADPHDLERQVDDMLAAIPPLPADEPAPKAIIAPHAGYIYSGPIAAAAYARLRPAKGKISRVILIGPSHRVAFKGIALSQAEQWATPLGPVAIDRDGFAPLAQVPMVGFLDQAHAQEHSLEVHVPFLIRTLGHFSLIPMVVGDAPPETVAAGWGD